MSEINWDDIIDEVRDSANKEAVKLLEEWKPVIVSLGKDAVAALLNLILNDKDEEAIDLLLENATPEELLDSAIADVEKAIKDRESAQGFLSAIKDTVIGIGSSILKKALIAAI